MLQTLLELFTTEQKAAVMLSNPIIELIFMTLFLMFTITLSVHFLLFFRLKNIRNQLKETGELIKEPLKSFQKTFVEQQQKESINTETFVQESFSSWRMFHVPVVSLIKIIQMTVSIFILLGVLGTFIGLTISLGSISSTGDQLVENVASVLSGIDVAFYTSIIGMGFSLIMTVVLRLFNSEYMLTDIMLMTESKLTSEEQQGIGQLIKVSEAINQSILGLQETHEQSLQGIVDAFSGFKHYTEDLKQSAEDLNAFNEGLSDNLNDFQDLFQEMKNVTDGFSEGTKQLNGNFKTLFSHIKKSDHKNDRIVASIERADQHIETLSNAQVENLDIFTDKMESLESFSNTVLEDLINIQGTLEKTTDKNDAIAQTMGTHNETFKAIFGNHLSDELKQIGGHLKELSGGFKEVGQSITSLPRALEIINETQAEYKHLLGNRFQELKDFNQSFAQHLKNHTQEAATFDQQMRDATSTYEQMAQTHQKLIGEMNQTLSQWEQVSTKQDRQLETNVGYLRDALGKYMTNFEGTVGNQFEQVIRQIGDSMDRTSDDIKREFMEIKRLNENIHQHYSQSMQQLLQDVGREIQALNRNLTSIQQPGNAQNRIGWNPHDS